MNFDHLHLHYYTIIYKEWYVGALEVAVVNLKWKYRNRRSFTNTTSL